MTAASQPGRTIAIGDIHGCVHALDALLAAIQLQPADTLVVLGDFIDKGRDTRDVFDRLLELEQAFQVVLILGNHEEMLLAARHNKAAQAHWEMCGGVAALNSYYFGAELWVIPEEHWDLLARCRDYYETERFLFFHANYDPLLAPAEQPVHMLRWAMLEEPFAPHMSGKTVIVGHTEQRSGEVLDAGFVKCIDTACWKGRWLTALDVDSGQLWQASRYGVLRLGHEQPAG